MRGEHEWRVSERGKETGGGVDTLLLHETPARDQERSVD